MPSRNHVTSTASAVALFFGMLANAQAALLIDTAPVVNPSSLTDNRCDGAISLKIVPAVDTPISQLEAYIDPDAATNVRFLIADNPQNTVLYYGPAVSVSADTQWVTSPAFNFTLQAGQTYEIAAMVEGCANFPWSLSNATDNGLTAVAENGNPDNYDAPTGLGEVNGVVPRFRIYDGGALPPSAAPVPVMPIWLLALVGGVLGYLGVRKLKK